jgi:hypothetical protein
VVHAYLEGLRVVDFEAFTGHRIDLLGVHLFKLDWLEITERADAARALRLEANAGSAGNEDAARGSNQFDMATVDHPFGFEFVPAACACLFA